MGKVYGSIWGYAVGSQIIQYRSRLEMLVNWSSGVGIDLHLHGLKSNGLFNFNVTISNRATYEEFQ